MKSFDVLFSLLSLLTSVSWISKIQAEPVQFCKFGFLDLPEEKVDFCVSTLMYRNTSSNAHDLFLTINLHRPKGSALGWTALGLGTLMKGSLMFIIYGDPLSKERPIVSIRTATGHHQPTLLKKTDLAEGMDLRVISSMWLPDQDNDQDPENPSHAARVSLVCYSCHLWPGTEISAQSRSQPWIWAWNAKQQFDVFSFDAHLSMHKHHAGAGGWGNFYLDMARSISTAKFPPSLPPILPHLATIGSSDTPMSFSGSIAALAKGPASYLHGAILATVFLLMFPAGVVGMLAGHPRSFTYHWITQIGASVLLLLGVGLGLLKNRKISTAHQYLGIIIPLCVGAQGLLGWWHHRKFIRLHRRTWVSHVHIWLGRIIMLCGWTNIISGLFLRGYSRKSAIVVVAIVIVSLQAVGFGAWALWAQRKQAKYPPKPSWREDGASDFALCSSDDPDDEETVTAEGEDELKDEDSKERLLGSRDAL